MRGSLKQRYRGSWSIILDLAYEPHPETGKLRRRQKWHTFRGTRAEAEKKLRALLTTVDAGSYVDATKVTLGEWLREWLEGTVKPRLRARTYSRYKGIIERDPGQREYNKLVKAANIPRIKFHGLRHTCATLLLQAGQPVHVVSERARALKGDDDSRNLCARPARHAEGRRLDALGTAPRRPLAIR